MKRSVIISALCLLAGFFSCSKQNAGLGMRELYVSCDGGAKVSLSRGNKTVWNRNDALSVFYGDKINRKWKYTGQDRASSGKIEGEAEGSAKDGVAALYPYNSKSTLKDGVLTAELNHEQTFLSGSYSAKDVVMYAAGNSDRLEFGYAVSVVALKLGVAGACKVEEVEFSSASLKDVAGNMTISTSDGAVSVKGYGSISMKYGKTISGADTETFYFCVAPGEYESGLQFKVKTGGEDWTVRYTSPLSLEAGDMVMVEDVLCSSSSTVTLDFSKNNVFEQKLPGSSFSGTKEYTLKTEEFGSLTFAVSCTAGGFYHTGSSLRLNNGVDSGNGYIMIPVPSGHILSQLFVTIDNQGTKSFKVGSSPGLSDICALQSVSPGVRQMFSTDSKGPDCYLYTSGKNAQIVKLELVYY